MPEIKWQEPPTNRQGRTNARRDKWREVADALRSQPGRWALVMEQASASNAENIKRGRKVAFTPAGTFDAVSRKREDGKYDIYARFVGEAVSS